MIVLGAVIAAAAVAVAHFFPLFNIIYIISIEFVLCMKLLVFFYV